ncbi:MAG TPA: lysophospholipid acyltransferase family protein [Candidatus Polarisedimenticolaceae bacterium]|nr:lysophospholipid acyltransferase family protein [Candidatus Polarisedimenticolaceae bacterium]
MTLTEARLAATSVALRVAFAPVLTAGFHLRMVGRPHLPDRGAAIVLSNHASFLDPFLISARCGRPVRWLVSREFYAKPQLQWALRWLGTIPVGGGRSMVRSYRRIAEVLSRGGLVGIFPEGGISRDGEMKTFHEGAAVLARRFDVPVVPMHIHGSYEALSRYAKWPRFVPITIRVGPPLRGDSFRNSDSRVSEAVPSNEVAALTEAMRAAIAALESENRAVPR